jgi:predicted NUDIX family NTP pyrophosphohydrolase
MRSRAWCARAGGCIDVRAQRNRAPIGWWSIRMPARVSAGIVLYRRRGDVLEVLLVHPGGPFWQRKDDGAWSLPKGEVEPGEALEAVARREFREETGHDAPATLVALAPVRQAGGKLVHPFAGEGDLDPADVRSNTFTMEWPPRSGAFRTFPEVDRAAWFDLPTAGVKVLAGQRPVLVELAERLADR